MPITISLPPETEAILRQRAAGTGQTVESYVQQLVEAALAPGSPERVLAAVEAAPHLPPAWVDELEQLIAEGQRPPMTK